jgi:hypothetical protein
LGDHLHKLPIFLVLGVVGFVGTQWLTVWCFLGIVLLLELIDAVWLDHLGAVLLVFF